MVNLGHVPCGSQQKNAQKPLQFADDPLKMPHESRRNRRKPMIDRVGAWYLLSVFAPKDAAFSLIAC
jgi:hypothetical protein